MAAVVYDASSKATVFAQSWDQALPPAQGHHTAGQHRQALPAQHQPQQFADNMNQTIGT
jgi:raffinose/stachyose/melibiose transport system substrate-binding protein